MAYQNFHNCSATVITARSQYRLVESTLALRAGLSSMHYGNTVQGTCCVEICTDNAWADFHTMYIHKMDVENKFDTMHHLYVFVSQGGGVGEKRLVFVSEKNIGIYG